MVVGLLVKGRRPRPWKELCLQSCICSPVRYRNRGTQHGGVQWSNTRAHSDLPPGPVDQNGSLRCSCSHRLSGFTDSMHANAHTSNSTLGSCSSVQCVDKDATKERCKGGVYGDFSCYQHGTTKSNIALGPSSLKNSVFVVSSSSSAKYSSSFIDSLLQQSMGICSVFLSQRKRESPFLWTQTRSYFSSGQNKTLSDRAAQLKDDSVFTLATADASEVDTKTASPPPPESDNDYNFWNFPALTSSHYQGYERPVQMQVKKRVTWQLKSKLFNKETTLTEECIPKPRGRTYDFGLGDMLSRPPPLEAGARPQGGFDTNISLSECEEAPASEALSVNSLVISEGLSIASRRKPPLDTLEADKGTEINVDDAVGHKEDVQSTLEDEYDLDMITESSGKLEAEENY